LNRKLTTAGLEEFESFVFSLRQDGRLSIPERLLEEPNYSEQSGLDVNFERRTFNTRYECGQYVAGLLKNVDTSAILHDRGFWSALALFWFDQLCPVKSTGVRKPSMAYNYVLSLNHWHYQRHAIRTSWQLVSTHGKNAQFLIGREMDVRGELVEQFMARQDYLSCDGVVECASRLYFDEKIGQYKKGSAARKSAGCIARYIAWLQQMEQTYDIFAINGSDLFNMLPEEFNKFKN